MKFGNNVIHTPFSSHNLHRCPEWVQNCRRADLMTKTPEYLSKNCSICSIHFEPDLLPKFCNQRRRLPRHAKPTLFDVPNPPPHLTITRKRTDRPFIEMGKYQYSNSLFSFAFACSSLFLIIGTINKLKYIVIQEVK